MSSSNPLEKVKKLRELTGVGFKDCKAAIDECKGDIEKSIEFLRKKGISKATKKMQRIAAEGLVSLNQDRNKISIIEINCETDFVAKNEEFINFSEKLAKLSLLNEGELEKILNSQMDNKKTVKDNLVDLISKIGEKIKIRRSACLKDKNCVNFSYVHSSVKPNVGKLGVLLGLETSSTDDSITDLGHKLSMHIAASNPLAIDVKDLNPNVLKKEEEIIKEELKSTKKNQTILDKITKGRLNKFIEENTLLNQVWIMDPKKKVKEIIAEVAGNNKINVKSFIRYKVGEGL